MTSIRFFVRLYWAYFRRELWLMPRFWRYVRCDLVENYRYNIGVMHVREFRKTVWEREMIILYRVAGPR